MDELTDDQLWLAGRRGNAQAFGLLFDRHHRKVYNYCFRRTADWSVAEDLTSATFVEAWSRRDLEVHGSAVPVLLGIATNLLRNHRRALRRFNAALPRLVQAHDVADHADDVVARLDDAETMAAVLGGIRSLRQREQDVLALVVWSGLSVEATAAALNIPAGTVKSTLSRARKKLARLVEPGRPAGHDMGSRLTATPADRT